MSSFQLSQTGFSFLNRSRSISIGGPDEDYSGCEIECFHPVTKEPRGKAVVVEQVAFAGLSHVYKCYFSEGPIEGTIAAAKILTTGYSMSGPKVAEVLNRLYDREVHSLAKLTHPHIIGFYGVGEVVKMGNTRRAIFLEWMPGGDARALIDQAMRPMDEGAAGTIILPLTEALGAAHAAGIVHRDVKAGNILLAPGIGQVKLADWGISVPVEESSSRMSLNGKQVRAPGSVGTEFWCAPEIERGLPHDTSSDIFSLAITFIELVTGRDPKYDNTPEGVRELHLPETGFIPPGLSEAARDWLAQCLVLEPKQRPSVAQLLQHKFFKEVQAQMAEAAARAEEEEGEGEDGDTANNGLPALRPLSPGQPPSSLTLRGSGGNAAQQASRRAAAMKAVTAVPAETPRGPAPYEIDDTLDSTPGSKQPKCCAVM
mmetsp:Transcript_25777/g.65556  ORF Transcript_25777/g.65556 Transcript_25777/m.65556 type:complete len:428 (-) Transcript_25777:176-1459(-)